MNQSLKVLAVQILAIALIGGMMVAIISCSQNRQPLPPGEQSPEVAPLAKETHKAVESVKPPLAAATQKARDLTTQNLPVEKPLLTQLLDTAWGNLNTALASAESLETKAKAADKASAKLFENVQERDNRIAEQAEAITKLEKKLDDYNKSIVTWTLRGLLVLCGLASMGGIYLLVKMDFWNGGALLATGIAGGALFIFAIHIQQQIVWIVGGVLAVAVLVFVYLAYRRLHDGKASIVKANQVAIATGALDLDAAAPIFDAIETKFAKGFVDRNTPKKPTPDPTHYINPAIPANDSTNLVGA
jgi:hypothetical protein